MSEIFGLQKRLNDKIDSTISRVKTYFGDALISQINIRSADGTVANTFTTIEEDERERIETLFSVLEFQKYSSPEEYQLSSNIAFNYLFDNNAWKGSNAGKNIAWVTDSELANKGMNWIDEVVFDEALYDDVSQSIRFSCNGIISDKKIIVTLKKQEA